MSSDAPRPDDNLITKRASVKANIDVIKERKQKILATLGTLSKNEEPDKDLMGKLVGAFDVLTHQEKQYMDILQSIIGIHEKAASDVAEEVETARKKLQEQGVSLPVEKKEEAEGEAEPEDYDTQDIESLLREIGEVSAKAVAASLLNDQLVSKLNLSKSKHIAMKQQRNDRAETQQKKAEAALTDVEKTRLQVLAERHSMDRKKKELDKLRQAVVEKHCQEDDTHTIQVEVSESERIPAVEEEKPKEQEAEKKEDECIEEKRKQIKARLKQEKERREQLQATIREKLAAMDARRQRMQAIRSILSNQEEREKAEAEEGEPEKEEEGEERETKKLEREKAVREETNKEIEERLEEARNSLMHLTAFRERLEELKERGEEPTDADEDIVQRLMEGEEEEETAANAMTE